VAVPTSYERIPYSNHPYRQAHHDQLAVAGVLHGLEPPPTATARVLELGCGAGGHLIATAYALPGVRALGVDLAPSVIAQAQAEAQAAGVANVAFQAADLRDLVDGSLGEFDYVVAHGVHSWVPADAREALLAATRAHLAPGGLAYVSFNANPGGHLRAMVRDACLFHARDARDDDERVAKAREMLELLHHWRASDEAADAYGRFLLDVLPRLSEAADGTLAHDLLSEDSSPLWYAGFAADAARHGLAPVGESRLVEPALLPRDRAVRDAIARLSGGDRVAREQLVDLFGHGRFRETVLAHAEVASGTLDDPDPAALRRLVFLAPPPPEGAPLAGLLTAIAGRRPRASSFDELASVTGAPADALSAALLDCLRLGLVTAWLDPPRAVGAGARPRASALARWQAREGRPATSLLHTVVVLDPAGAHLLDLLDGTRSLDEVGEALREATGLSLDADAVEANVRSLAVAGLLEGDGPA
jgi:SAM-dependent methyltransferase